MSKNPERVRHGSIKEALTQACHDIPELYIEDALTQACHDIPELCLDNEHDVTVVFAGEGRFSTSDSRPLVILIELLFDKPERTLEVRQNLAEALGKAAKSFVGARRVEVAVKRFNPEKDAFWTG